MPYIDSLNVNGVDYTIQVEGGQSADLATVATTGSYNDLTDKPTNVSSFTNDAGYLTAHQDISGKANSADLATVATSGSYNDLTNKPTIPDTFGVDCTVVSAVPDASVMDDGALYFVSAGDYADSRDNFWYNAYIKVNGDCVKLTGASKEWVKSKIDEKIAAITDGDEVSY